MLAIHRFGNDRRTCGTPSLPVGTARRPGSGRHSRTLTSRLPRAPLDTMARREACGEKFEGGACFGLWGEAEVLASLVQGRRQVV
jgi:hypothetical protein